MVTKAVVAFGPSDACCGPSLSGAGRVMADSWELASPGMPFLGESLGQSNLNGC